MDRPGMECLMSQLHVVSEEHPEALLTCPACLDAGRAEPVRSAGQYEVCQCPTCGVRFSNPMRAAGAEWYEQSPLYHGRRALNVPLPVYLLDWRYRTFLS